jgi:dipeptide/tripeptide permease
MWDHADASEFYGAFTISIYVLTCIGGILSDLTRKPVLICIIGNSITTCGIFMLAFAEQPMTVYIAAGAIALGTGLFKPSIIAALFRSSFTHKHRFDLIVTVFYCAINFGAFLAPLIIGWFGVIGQPQGFRTGFIIAGIFSLLPTVILASCYRILVYNDLNYDNQSFKSNEIGTTNVILWFVLTIIFWLAYELFPQFSGAITESSTQIIMMMAALIFYLIMIPLHLIKNFRSALKICAGLLMVALVCVAFPLLHLPPMAGLLLFAIAEVMIIPTLWSQIIQHVSPKFTGMIMSLLMLMTVGINKVAGALSDASYDEQPTILYVIALLCLGLIAAFLVLDQFQKQREQNMPQIPFM